MGRGDILRHRTTGGGRLHHLRNSVDAVRSASLPVVLLPKIISPSRSILQTVYKVSLRKRITNRQAHTTRTPDLQVTCRVRLSPEDIKILDKCLPAMMLNAPKRLGDGQAKKGSPTTCIGSTGT